MAVYTTLSEIEIRSLLSRFPLSDLNSFQGVSSGIENTTYFLTLNSGDEYVLTVFENFSSDSLRPYIQLLSLLSSHHLPIPCPCVDVHGSALQLIANKPALLLPRAPGTHVDNPAPAVCYAVGSILASIHSVAPPVDSELFTLQNPCGLSWMKETLALVNSSLSNVETTLLHEQITLSAELEARALPRGIIHGDLFRDNVLIENNTVTAVIDFYNAGQDTLLVDLAITANDWCYTQADTAAVEKNLEALLAGYNLKRPLCAPELGSWRECLQVAAARLWLSRQKRLVLSRQGGKGAVKNPDEYKSLLLRHCTTLSHPP